MPKDSRETYEASFADTAAFTRLARGNLSIQSLTDFCGYRTPQALRKAFKRHTGMSAAEWRRRQTPLFVHSAP